MKKKNGKPIASEAIEFQSDALELSESRLPFFARSGIWMILLFFAAALIWSAACKVDVIVEAEGKLISSEPSVVMKPLERTVVKEINVKVGEIVKKGQTLITFDPAFSKADEERLNEQYNSLNAQFLRLKTEAIGEHYAGIPGSSDDEKWQKAILDKRRKFYDEKIHYYAQNIKRIEAAINTTNESFKNQQSRLETLMRIEKMFLELQDKKAVSLKQCLETQISRIQMEGDVEILKNKLLELSHERLSEIANKNSFIEEWDKKVSEEMVEVEREMTSVKKQLDKARQLSSYVYIQAPCDAVVHEIAAFPKGSAVREAEPLITLIPVNTRIEAEVNILPKDIGKIRPGDLARIKLSAFPFQEYGTLSGKLYYISRDTFQEQGAMGQKQSSYRGRLLISGKLERIPDNFTLIPGMELKAELKVGKRRIIKYLIDPLIKALDESIREP